LDYRIKPPELFAIDGDGWLSAVNTLVEDTYTMAVVAHDGDPVDAALIVVHVQDSSTPASLSDTFDGATLVAVAVAIVSGVLVLISLLLIIILFVKNRRYVVHYANFVFFCFSAYLLYN